MTNLDKSNASFFHPIFLYGPPGSGKTTVAKELANNLAVPFVDLDRMIEEQAGKSIPEIFAEQGEDGFRRLEKKALQDVLKLEWGIIALGGGTLIDEDNRDDLRRGGSNIILEASEQTIIDRLTSDELQRPLLVEQDKTIFPSKLQKLLDERASHYASFENRIVTDSRAPVDIAWDAQVTAGAFYVRGMTSNPGKGNLSGAGKNRPGPPGYDVRVANALDNIGKAMRLHSMSGPVVIVTDQNVAGHYLSRVEKSLRAEDYSTRAIIIPPGEESKTMVMVSQLWETFLGAGLERGSTVVALGGGVVGDLAGFAAATYMRGIPWVNVPTTLLAMVDASLGGKTGVDLPRGKNLVGAFHAPRMVLADPSTLKTLPRDEQRSGMAEVIKTGVIGDPALFGSSSHGWGIIESDYDELIPRAMAVKIKVIEADPFEQGLRAVLNLGHTVGHAVEKVSNYSIRHGEAVAIGIVAEARLSERIGLAEGGLADEIADACKQIELPVVIPEALPREDILEAMKFDKKREAAKVKFALPVKIGEVRPGIDVSDLEDLLW